MDLTTPQEEVEVETGQEEEETEDHRTITTVEEHEGEEESSEDYKDSNEEEVKKWSLNFHDFNDKFLNMNAFKSIKWKEPRDFRVFAIILYTSFRIISLQIF